MSPGGYLYESIGEEGPAVRLGMLHHSEARDIGRKVQRRDVFESYRDRVSQHDMDFDWSDETRHSPMSHYS